MIPIFRIYLSYLQARVKNKMIKEIINSVYPVSAKSINEVEDIMEFRSVDKGDTFIKRNKRDTNEYFILEGICRTYLLSPEGEEITLSFFTSNSILSPYSTRTKDEISLLNFQALTDIQLSSMNAINFEELMINNLEIRRFGNTVLRNELTKKVDREIGLASLSAKERLLKFREEYPLLENLIPHTHIASYLGITNISLSRLRSNLAR